MVPSENILYQNLNQNNNMKTIIYTLTAEEAVLEGLEQNSLRIIYISLTESIRKN